VDRAAGEEGLAGESCEALRFSAPFQVTIREPMPGPLVLRGKYWWDVWLLDPVEGRARRRASFRRDRTTLNGFAVARRFTMFAVYAWNGELVFRAGARTWNLLAPDVRVTWRRLPGGRQNLLTVLERGEEALRIEYRSAWATASARIGPTFDAGDERLDDFFLGVAELAADRAWMERMFAAWSAPADPPNPA
jgi:hypothetical protein